MFFSEVSIFGRSAMAIFLFACAVMLSSCDSGKNGGPGSGKNVPQQFSGTLHVRIMPENPTSWNDLQALYSGNKGVSYSWDKNGVTLAGEKSEKLSRKNLAKGDSITVTVRAGNETGSATVEIGNAPPQVISINLDPAVVYTGVDIAAKPNSMDPDSGDDIRYDYQWFVNEQEVFDNSPVLKGEKLKKGDRITLIVTPSDGEDNGTPYKVNAAEIRNSSPFFISTPPVNFKSSSYRYQVSATDPDGDKITYSLASSPAGMTIDPLSGMITWLISKENGGSYQVEIVASDNEGAKSMQKYSLNISLNNGTNQ